jgi:hypothetical protein
MRLRKEADERRQGGPSGQGQPQNPNVPQYQAPGHFQGQPIDVEQEQPLSPQQRRSAQQKAAMAQAAAKMAQDAASMAQNAAEMARQAAELAARAVDLPWDGPSPPTQAFFNTARGHGSSHIAPMVPQPPQQIDQPIENYQSQFPASEQPKRKRKSRASGQEASGAGGGRPVAAMAPNPGAGPETLGPHGLNDYQVQLMLLERQDRKKKQLMDAKQQRRSGEGSGSGGA